MKPPGRHITWLLILLGVGAVLRAIRLDAASFWSDEAQSVWIALGPTAERVWQDTRRALYEPPLFNVALHIVLSTAGVVTELTARALPWLASVAGLAVFAGLAFRTLTPGAAWLAIGLASFAPYQVYLAQECRMYSLLFLWEAGSAACLIAALAARPPRRSTTAWWAGYAACLTAAALTHHLAAVWGIAHAVYVAVHPPARRRWKAFALASVPAALTGAALLLSQRGQLAGLLTGGQYDAQPLAGTLHDALALGGTAMRLDPGPRTALVVLAAAVAVRGALKLGRAAPFALIHTIAPLFAMHSLHAWGAVHAPLLRYAIGAQAGLLLLLAAGLTGPVRGRRRWLARTAAALLVAGALVSLSRHYAGTPARFGLLPAKKPLRAVAEFIGTRLADGDVVVHVSLNSALPCRLYLPHVRQSYLLPSPVYDTPGGRAVYGGPESLDLALKGAKRVWLVSCPASWRLDGAPPRDVTVMLARRVGTPTRWTFPGVEVYLARVRSAKDAGDPRGD